MEERGSEEKTGRARTFGRSVCSNSLDAISRPSKMRLNRRVVLIESVTRRRAFLKGYVVPQCRDPVMTMVLGNPLLV